MRRNLSITNVWRCCPSSNRLYFGRLVSFRLLCERSRTHTVYPPHSVIFILMPTTTILMFAGAAIIKVSLSCFVFVKLHAVSARTCSLSLSLAYDCGCSAYPFIHILLPRIRYFFILVFFSLSLVVFACGLLLFLVLLLYGHTVAYNWSTQKTKSNSRWIGFELLYFNQ